MNKMQRSSLSRYRARRRREGVVRVEVQVHKDDADLIREVAKALNDPSQATAIRAKLRASERYQGMDFKQFLASIPLDGIELERERGYDRDVDLWGT